MRRYRIPRLAKRRESIVWYIEAVNKTSLSAKHLEVRKKRFIYSVAYRSCGISRSSSRLRGSALKRALTMSPMRLPTLHGVAAENYVRRRVPVGLQRRGPMNKFI